MPTARITTREDVRALLRVRRPLDAVPRVAQEREVGRSDGVVVRRVVLVPPGGGTGADDDAPLPGGTPPPGDGPLPGDALRPHDAPLPDLATLPDDAVPCLVLTPEGPGPRPGVVAIHQHDGEHGVGKSEPAGLAGDPTLAYGVALARRGAVVVVPDLSGFEERDARPPGGAQGERLEAFRLLAAGTTLAARHVEDVALALTWLVARDDVVGRPGLVGHSLGGQVAFLAALCDARVAAAALSCGLGTLASFDAARVLHNPAWYVPDLVAVGDTPALAAVAGDQRFWVGAGAADPLFPVDGVRAAVAGFPPGAAHLAVHPGGHGWPPDALAEAADWLVDVLRAGG